MKHDFHSVHGAPKSILIPHGPKKQPQPATSILQLLFEFEEAILALVKGANRVSIVEKASHQRRTNRSACTGDKDA
jgi:hypothetical protein